MWNKKRLGELCLIKSGDSNARDADKNGKYALFDRSKKIKKSKRFLFDCEALIIPGEGKEFLPRYYKGKFDLHQRAYAIHQFKPELNIQYLFYYLICNKDYFSKVAVGATVKSLRQRHFDNLEVYFPSLAEQQSIVDKLDAVFVKINKSIKATEKGLELAKISLNNTIDAKTTFRQNWKKYKISDLGLVQTGNTPKTSNKKNYGDDIPFVKPPNFRKNGTIEVIKDGLSKEGAKFSRKANANTVMMVCIGATIGKVAINHEDVCFNQQINSLTPIKEYDAELIYWQMRGNRFQAEVQKKAGQATLPIISKSKWQSIDIFLPESLNEQIDIRTKLRKLSDYIDSYNKIKSQKLIELNKLKLSILIKELKPREAA